MLRPSTKAKGGGASLGSPSRAPVSAQSANTFISAGCKDRSFANEECAGSANHGGIFLTNTASRIARAQGRVSRYVRNDMGAASPGLWHPWHRRWRTGKTSLWNVTGASAAITAESGNSNATLAVLIGILPARRQVYRGY